MNTIVKILRIINNDTQKSLADLVGITQSNFNLKENGKLSFTLREAQLIAKKYNISLDSLVNGNRTKEKIVDLLRS